MALQTTLTASEARSETGFVQKIPSNAGEKIRRVWTNIDASVADTLVASAEAVGTAGIITNPQVDGQTYTGSYAVSNVSVSDPDANRAVTITQELVLVVALTSTISTLTNQTPIKTKKNTILRRYALAEGEEDDVAYIYPYINPTDASISAFFGYSDSDIETALGLGAGTYINRDFKDQEDGTGVAVIHAKTAVWTAWSTDPVHQILTYSQAGANNEREALTKEWFGVQKADVQTALDELRSGSEHVSATAGYIIVAAKGSDNGDGSVTLTQVQIKQLDDVKTADDRSDEQWIINQHSFSGMLGTMSQQTIIYENFTKSDIQDTNVANPTAYATGTNNVQSNVAKVMGSGLWQRIIIKQSVSWENTLPTEVQIGSNNVPDDGWTVIDQPNVLNDVIGQGLTEYARGIPIDDLDDKIAAIEPDAGHGLVSVSGYEASKGEGAYTKRQKVWHNHKPEGSVTKPMEIKHIASSGEQKALKHYVWFDVQHDQIADVYAEAATYGVIGDFVHKTRWREPQADGSSHIHCQVWIPDDNGESAYDNTDVWWTYYNTSDKTITEIQQFRVQSIGTAEGFLQGGLSPYAIDAHNNDPGALWGGTLTDAVIVGADSGNRTELIRLGAYKYLAIRVIKKESDIG
jgi:hypothetical protein